MKLNTLKATLLATAIVMLLGAATAHSDDGIADDVIADDVIAEDAATAESAESAADAWITSKVKAQLMADDTVKGRNIVVETAGSVVTLTGFVETFAQRDAAIRITAATSGVASVSADYLSVTSE